MRAIHITPLFICALTVAAVSGCNGELEITIGHSSSSSSGGGGGGAGGTTTSAGGAGGVATGGGGAGGEGGVVTGSGGAGGQGGATTGSGGEGGAGGQGGATTGSGGAGGTGGTILVCGGDLNDCNDDPSDGCESDSNTDINNCGHCGTVCTPGIVPDTVATCVDGACGVGCAVGRGDCDGNPVNGCETTLPDGAAACVSEILTTGLTRPNDLRVDGGFVYWTEAGIGAENGSIKRMPVAGGAVTTVAANQDAPYGIAVRGSTVYWTTNDINNDFFGDLRSAPITSVNVTPTIIASAQPGPTLVTTDGTFVYWANTGSTPASYTDGSINKAPLAGGPSVVVAANQAAAQGVTVDANNIYWTGAGVNFANGFVRSMPLAGGAITTYATNQSIPVGIAVSAQTIFWAVSGAPGPSVQSIPIANNAVAKKIAEGTPMLLTVDSNDFVYWSHYTASGLVGRSYPTGVGTTFTAAGGYPFGIATDATHVYWASQGDKTAGSGSIRRAIKLFP